MSDRESENILKGTTLEIYRLVLKTSRPLGIREIQRALNLSSPSQAQYHLTKLEEAGLLKREMGNYVINKVILENCVRISRFLIPRYLFYSIFAIAILLFGVFLRPTILNREYFLFISSTSIFVCIFCYEAAKVWLKGSL